MITIGIVSFNRLKYLKSLLRSLDALDRNKFNVIVVDNGSWETGIRNFLESQRESGKIQKLFLRSTEERNWINDEYIAKNIVIEESRDDLIVFLQDDLQLIADQEYLERICQDFESTDFACMEFNGIRRVTNRSKFARKKNAVSEGGIRYWISDAPHFQTMGIFRRKTFLDLGPYPTNWPKDRSYWGRSETHYDNLVKAKMPRVNLSTHFPAFLGVWNDHRGGYSFIRDDLRYADYLDPVDPSGLYYQTYSFSEIKSRQDGIEPLSFMDVARPLGWKVATTPDGDQVKYSQNDIVAKGNGQRIA